MSDDRTDPVPMYAISEVALDDIQAWFTRTPDQMQDGSGIDRILGFIRAAFENGPIKDTQTWKPQADYALRVSEERRDSVTRQRDFLIAQVDSLLGRLAASHVASGLINMANAQGFVQKEAMPINAVLQGMAANNQGEE